MDEGANIWLEVGQYRNKWTICQCYREFKILGVNGSESLVEQNTRFDKFLNKIASADNTRNTLIIGDININMNDNHDHNNHEVPVLFNETNEISLTAR